MAGFPRHARLVQACQYQYVFAAPERKSSDRYFTVLGRFVAPEVGARLGIVVAKKAIRRAHERNRVKRLIRESFRLNAMDLGLDMVVMVRAAAEQVDNLTLYRALEAHWQRLH